MTDREKLPSGDVVAYMWTDPTHQRPPELHWHCDMGPPYEGWIATPLSAMPDRQAERAAIVAWLRAYKRDDTNWPQVLANAIENGEHLKG